MKYVSLPCRRNLDNMTATGGILVRVKALVSISEGTLSY